MVREQIQPTSNGADDSNIPFIDFIICPQYDLAYKEEVLKDYGLTVYDYRSNGKYYPEMLGNGTMDSKSFFRLVTHNLSEILMELSFSTLSKENYLLNEVLGVRREFNYSLILVTTKYTPTFGRCFSIQPKDHVVKLGIIKITMKTRMNSYVYFGYPGQFQYRTKTKVLFFVM